jgi:hypothetical protein
MFVHCSVCLALPRYISPDHILHKTKWVDLLWSWVSLYNTIMKVFFIASSAYILYLMKRPFRPTHDPNLDTFKIEYLLIGSLVASLIFNYEFSFAEVTPKQFRLVKRRFSGHSVFGSKASPYCLNFLLFRELEKRKISPHIIYLPLVHIEHSTFQTGFIDTCQIVILIPSLYLQDLFK